MAPDNELYEIEVLDGELVESPHAPLDATAAERLPGLTAQPAVQTAMAAATGFVAGAATMALLRRYAQTRVARSGVGATLAVRPGQARTFVVTVRQLG